MGSVQHMPLERNVRVLNSPSVWSVGVVIDWTISFLSLLEDEICDFLSLKESGKEAS